MQDDHDPPKNLTPLNANPVMIRVYNDGNKGATAFFRNRPFIASLFDELLATPVEGPLKILVHACSVGAEPWSLALWWKNRLQPLYPMIRLEISASDHDAGFLEYARRGQYPDGLIAGMTAEEASWFARSGNALTIPPEVRPLVRFLPPLNFVDTLPGGSFDAVLIMNALTYITVPEQSRAIQNCARYTRALLGLTAFHPDTIAADLQRAGFSPSPLRHREIHESWGDRLSQTPISPSSPEYSWRLPPYDTPHPDPAFRFGSLFRSTRRSEESSAT